MGSQKIWTWKHILQVSHDDEWLDSSKFPPSLGLYATIPKAKRGQPLDQTHYWYLDTSHNMDIAFGNCLSIGGYPYPLIFVDDALWYNWTFGLNLSSSFILAAICLFWAAAGSLAWCLYSDCDTKLFDTAISKYLIGNNSKVVAAPTRSQLSNGLVEYTGK
jgi:hypothetical protein